MRRESPEKQEPTAEKTWKLPVIFFSVKSVISRIGYRKTIA